MYADEEDTGVQALDIACCDNVDMREFAGWEEDVGWDVWVEDDGVCIDPPVLLLVLGVLSRRGEWKGRTSTILLSETLVSRVLGRLVGS